MLAKIAANTIFGSEKLRTPVSVEQSNCETEREFEIGLAGLPQDTTEHGGVGLDADGKFIWPRFEQNAQTDGIQDFYQRPGRRNQ